MEVIYIISIIFVLLITVLWCIGMLNILREIRKNIHTYTKEETKELSDKLFKELFE